MRGKVKNIAFSLLQNVRAIVGVAGEESVSEFLIRDSDNRACVLEKRKCNISYFYASSYTSPLSDGP